MPQPPATPLAVDDASAEKLGKALKLDTFYLEFKAAQVKGVFPHATFSLYPPGYRLLTQGESGRDLYVVIEGKVSVLRPFVMQEIFVGAGEILGEMGLVRDGVRTATVIAAEPSKIFLLPFQDLQYLMANNQDLGTHLSNIAYHRL